MPLFVNSVVLNPEYAEPLERTLGFALILVALDYFLALGPAKHLTLKLFKSPNPAASPAGKRLCGQVAARAVGSFFLFVMFPRALRVLFDSNLATNPIYATSTESYNCMILAAGYFLYDVILCITRFSENGIAFSIHAVVCCFAYCTAIVTGQLHHIGAGFLLWEASTPFLYFRWVLLKAGLAESKYLMPFANYAFILVFFFCRVVYGPLLSKEFFLATQKELVNPHPGGMSTETIYGYYAAMIVMNSLNYYWFLNMMRLALFGNKNVHGAEKVEHRHKD